MNFPTKPVLYGYSSDHQYLIVPSTGYAQGRRQMMLLTTRFPEARTDAMGRTLTLPADVHITEKLYSTRGDYDWHQSAIVLMSEVLDDHSAEVTRQTAQPKAKVRDTSKPHIKKTLTPYQERVSSLMSTSSRGLIDMPCGSGKTVTAVDTVCNAFASNELDTALIISPVSGLTTWERELGEAGLDYVKIETIHDLVGLRFSIDAKRVLLVGYQTLLMGHAAMDRATLQKMFSGIVICDDPTAISNDLNKTYKMLRKLTQGHAQKFFILNATPMDNRLEELYVQLDLLNPEVLGNWRDFKKNYIGPNGKLYGLDLLRKRLVGNVIHVGEAEVVKHAPKPTKVRHHIIVEMSDYQRRLYNEYVESYSEHGDYIGMFTRLQQVCNDPRLVNPNYLQSSIKSSKIDAAKAIISMYGKCLVFTQFSEWARILREELSEFSPIIYTGTMTPNQKARVEELFNSNDNIKVLIVTQSGFRALNLPTVECVIKMDPLWMSMIQLEDRACRFDSVHDTVHIYSITTEAPIEKYKLDVVEKKVQNSKHVIDDLGKALRQGIVTKNELMEIAKARCE